MHAQAILHQPAAADDVVQAVMCRLLALPRERIEAVTDVAAFLSSSVRHEAMNHLRSSRRERARLRASWRDPGSGPDTPPYDPSRADRDELAAALASIPRRLREIVVLKHSCGLTFDQVAAVLETNRNTVAARYRSAVELLRLALQDRARAEVPAPGGPTSRHQAQGAAHA